MKKMIAICFFSILFTAEMETTYNADGMMCSISCPKGIKKSLEGVNGIKNCSVNFNNKTTTIIFDRKNYK